jgi:hypothetical protein
MPARLKPGPHLDKVLMDYWNDRAHWNFATTSQVEPPVFKPELRPLSEATVHGILARVSSGHNKQRADFEVQQALRLDPDELNALRVAFYSLPSTKASRAAIARRATQAHPQSAEAWSLAADVHFGEPEGRAALERAERLDPLNARVHVGLGFTLLNERKFEAALPHIVFACRKLLPSGGLLQALVVSLAACGRCAEARALSENRLPGYPDSARRLLREAYASTHADCSSASPSQ